MCKNIQIKKILEVASLLVVSVLIPNSGPAVGLLRVSIELPPKFTSAQFSLCVCNNH